MATASVALFLALGSAVGFGASAGLRTETRAGLIPTGGATTSDPSLDFVVTPTGNVTLSRGDTAFTLGYNVRLLRRFFVPTIDRFIILHNANAGYSDQFGRGWRLRANVAASLGEVDYATAGTVIGGQAQTGGATGNNTNNQTVNNGNVPNAAIVPLLNLSGVVALGGSVGRNHGVGFTFSVSQVRPIGSVDPSQQTFANTIGAGVGANYSYTVTARLGVSAGAGLNFTTFDDPTGAANSENSNFRSGSANFGVNYQFSPSSGATAQVGALVSDGTNGFLASPTGSLGYNFNVSNTAALQLGGQIMATVDGQANPITQSYDPRLSTQASFGGRIGSDWGVRIEAQFTTPLPIDPTGAESMTLTDAQNAATFVGGGIPVTYRVNDTVSAEFGVRAQAQAPRLDSDMFQFISPSITGYIALAATVGTAGP